MTTELTCEQERCSNAISIANKLKLDLLALFVQHGRAQPFSVSEAFKLSLQKVVDTVDEAGLCYEQVGRSLSLRPEVRAAELHIHNS